MHLFEQEVEHEFETLESNLQGKQKANKLQEKLTHLSLRQILTCKGNKSGECQETLLYMHKLLHLNETNIGSAMNEGGSAVHDPYVCMHVVLSDGRGHSIFRIMFSYCDK